MHLGKKGQGLGFKTVGHAGIGQAFGGNGRVQGKPQRHVGLQQVAAGLALHPLLQLRQDGQIKTAPMALIGKGRIGESVAQHHMALGQCRQDDFLDVVAPGGKHQQGLGQRVHGVVQHHLAQFFRQGRAARFAGEGHFSPLLAKGVGQALDVGGLARPIHPFKTDENALAHESIVPCPWGVQGVALLGWRRRWYRSTAALWSSKLALNALLPSPRATK